MPLDDYDIHEFTEWCDEIDGDLNEAEDGNVLSCTVGESSVRIESFGAFRVDDRRGDFQTKIDTDWHDVPLAENIRRRGELLSIHTDDAGTPTVNVSPPRA